MYGTDLHRLAKQMLGARFQGILNAAQRPRLVPGTCCIQNTRASAPGRHWLAIGIFRDSAGEARTMGWDSYGNMPEAVAERQLIEADTWTDPDMHQTKESQVCGAMALAWCVIFVRRGYKIAAQV